MMINAKMEPSTRDIPVMIANVQAFYAQGRMDLLIDEILPLLELLPGEAALHNVAGVAYAGLGRLNEAVAAYDMAVALQPGFADAWSNRGVVLRDHGRLVDALASFDMAIERQPSFAMAYANRGIALKTLLRHQEALMDYDRALDLAPDVSASHYNRANVLLDLRRLDEAVAAYDRAIALCPDYAEAHSNRGNALQQLGRLTEAAASFDLAITCDPVFADAYMNRGNVLHELRQMDEAARSYAEALRLKPGEARVQARARFLKAHMCDWTDGNYRDGIESLGVETEAVPTFGILALDDSAARNLIRSSRWAKANYSARQHVPISAAADSGRIRLGYFSADFHNHATMYLMARLLELHDKSRFEIHLFSYGPDRQDAMRERAVKASDHFHDVRALSDADVAALAREHAIDIAVDLKGYTQDSRLEIFALGAAPVQITYLGYPGTSGADFFDYVIADAVVIPQENRQFYTEKLICLPHSYQVNDDQRPIAEDTPERGHHNLPPKGFVFCCFNNSFKISSREFAIWMRLLLQIDDSVLWLLNDNTSVVANLRRAAAAHNVSPDRLVFADRLPLPQHLARHRRADLFLDTFTYNAHTTASDALWAGLPLVTKCGDGFAARVGASLLKAVGLAELVADTDEAYETLALTLARDPARLARIKAELLAGRAQMPLFNAGQFARDIEHGYALAWENCRRGYPPEHIEIPVTG
ncbi:MAG: tetratricopeptide repeat protein [Rhizorhabdus sp.]|nr:tetratricopeptide repeat protein [Rhizorhabdus sp.]